MRIYGASGAAVAAKPAAARRGAGGAFSVAEEGPAHAAAQTGGLKAIATVDALLALQGIEGAMERKKRAVAKGRKALDLLDRLKVSLLDGSVDTSTFARLKVAAEGLTEASGDPGLDTVLAEIDLRLAVELAKAGVQ
jgi:hypothetical protein